MPRLHPCARCRRAPHAHRGAGGVHTWTRHPMTDSVSGQSRWDDNPRHDSWHRPLKKVPTGTPYSVLSKTASYRSATLAQFALHPILRPRQWPWPRHLGRHRAPYVAPASVSPDTLFGACPWLRRLPPPLLPASIGRSAASTSARRHQPRTQCLQAQFPGQNPLLEPFLLHMPVTSVAPLQYGDRRHTVGGVRPTPSASAMPTVLVSRAIPRRSCGALRPGEPP